MCSARPGSPGSRTRSAIAAEGRRWWGAPAIWANTLSRRMPKRRGTSADAVRSAVDQTFQAAAGQAQMTRERAQELVDELAGAAQRLRSALDELRPPSAEDVRELRERMEQLEARISALEKAGATPRSGTTRRTPRTTRSSRPKA